MSDQATADLIVDLDDNVAITPEGCIKLTMRQADILYVLSSSFGEPILRETAHVRVFGRTKAFNDVQFGTDLRKAVARLGPNYRLECLRIDAGRAVRLTRKDAA